jgi:hypothetical protein
MNAPEGCTAFIDDRGKVLVVVRSHWQSRPPVMPGDSAATAGRVGARIRSIVPSRQPSPARGAIDVRRLVLGVVVWRLGGWRARRGALRRRAATTRRVRPADDPPGLDVGPGSRAILGAETHHADDHARATEPRP